ncbi:myb/SANT-like domain, Harbinger transposase-derived nuclease domain protein [Artemisia annua]|uniref:Myb/SANT-like domain, Harbinger transposase-derived nuclease domain protein n=1 Tax=Artemisia annua TaxID=35608 RepID=A0A2U1KS74_ARTAN|nr:myb/SANT-like domain, Harbinger transposase-derived nuclease domain protein [Artemisia annua]
MINKLRSICISLAMSCLTCFLTDLPFTLPNKSLLIIFAGIGVVRLVLELVYVLFMEAYKNKKYLPLDLRPTKARAIRRRLTKHQCVVLSANLLLYNISTLLLIAYLAIMEGPMEGPKQRKNWTNEMTRVLLETCIEEMQTTGRNGTSLYRSSWVRLGRVLKDKFGVEFTQKEMKNGFDNLRAKYNGWLYLKNKTGNIDNPDTKMFTLTQAEWEDFKQLHKRAGSLQSTPLPYLELCEIVFQSITANGDGQWTNSEGFGTSASGASASGASASGASASRASASRASAIREGVGALNIDEDPLVDVDIDDEDDGNSRTQRLHDEVRPKKKAKTSRVTFDDLAADMQVALRHMVKTKDEPTSAECYEKLKLVELQSMDPLFLAAFNIFGQSRDMREAWMALPSDPDVLKGWIQMTGRTFGIFK